MAIEIKNSDLEILAQNGISTDDVREAIPVLRKRGLSDEEIYNKIQTKIASFSTQKEEKPVAENTQKEQDYSATRAFINRAADAYAFGLGDKLAGLANTGVGQALQHVVNPVEAIKDPLQVSELDPRKYAEQYKQGRERFIEEQERFESENPAVAGVAEAVGTLAGFVGPKGFVNVGAKIAKPVMKVLPKAATTVGRLGKKVVATAAGESVALGAQGTLQGLGGVGSSRGGIEEAYERGKENLLIGAMGGGLGRAKVALHQPLTNIALKRVAQNKTIANLVAGGALSVADGTLMALGTNAVTNTENTTGNFLTNILFSGVGSAGSWAISKSLGKGRKLVTEPSDAKKAEIAENVEAFNKAKKIEAEIATTERIAEKGAKRLEKVQEQLQTSKKSLQVERENEAFYNREIKSLRNERRKLNKGLRKTAYKESINKEIEPRLDKNLQKQQELKDKIDLAKKRKEEISEEIKLSKERKDYTNKYNELKQENKKIDSFTDIDDLFEAFVPKDNKEKRLFIYKKIQEDKKLRDLLEKAVPIREKVLSKRKKGETFWETLKENKDLFEEFDSISKKVAERELKVAKKIIKSENVQEIKDLLKKAKSKTEIQEELYPIRKEVQQVARETLQNKLRLAGKRETGSAIKTQEVINKRWASKVGVKRTSEKVSQDIKDNESSYNLLKSQLQKTQERIMKGKGNRDALRQQVKDLREGLKENRKTKGLLEAERNSLLFPKKRKTVDITVSQEEIDTLRKQDPSINSDLVAKDLIVEQKIRETAKKQEKPSFRDRLVARTEEVRTVFDDLRPIKRAEELAGVSDYNQRGSNTIEKFRSGGNQEANLQPLADELERQSKISSTAVNKASRAASLEKKNQFLELGNKLTPEEEQLLKAYRSDETIKPILEQANNVRKKTLDNLLASGRIDKKTHDEWMKRDKYVPTTAEDVYGELTEDYRTNTNLQNRFKKYTGSVELEKNTIVETMVLNSQSERILAYQQAAKQYVNAAEKIGEAHRATNVPTWTPGQPVKYNRESQIVLWKNGVPEVWDVPTSIAKIFNPAPIQKHGKFITGVLNVLGGQMKLFKGTTTATSLGFSVVNPSRDIQSAVGGSKYGYLITNTDAINSYKEVIQANSPLYKAFKKEFGSSTKINVESLPKTAEDNINRALNLAKGIEKAGKEDSVSGAARQMLSQALIGKASKLKGFAGKAMNGFLEGMTYAGNKGEEATRFAVFNSVLEGRAPNEKVLQMWRENPRTIPHNVMAEAGREAREVTLNFRRQMHPAIEAANKYVAPYLKPAILGTIRAWDALTNPEIAPKTWNFIDTIGRMQAMLNINAVKDIEQMQEFENINNEILGKNFVFRAKGGGYYSIPLSQEFAPLVKLSSNMYESIYRALTGQYREDLLRETGVDVKELSKNMTPGIGYITEISNLIPGFAKPIVELAINKDLYSKTPIESEAQKMKPASRRFTQSTPRYLVKIASELSKYGVEVSPLQMHHLTKKIFSSTGREAGEAIDSALDSLDLLDLSVRKDIKDNPVIRRFVVNAFTAYSQTALDARNIIEDTKEYYKYMQKPDINLTDEQIDRFSKKSAVYASIKKLEQALQQNYSTRNKVYYGLANAGNELKLRYKKGQITKEDYETQKLNLISENSDYIEILKQQALRIEQQIIDVSKKVENELNKKSPR